MKIATGRSRFRQTIIAGIATLTLAGAAPSITPAEAFPMAAVPATGPAGTAATAPSIEHVHYRRYYRYHRWHPRFRAYGYRRYYRGAVPLPCRGRRTAMSKRYC